MSNTYKIHYQNKKYRYVKHLQNTLLKVKKSDMFNTYKIQYLNKKNQVCLTPTKYTT